MDCLIQQTISLLLTKQIQNPDSHPNLLMLSTTKVPRLMNGTSIIAKMLCLQIFYCILVLHNLCRAELLDHHNPFALQQEY